MASMNTLEQQLARLDKKPEPPAKGTTAPKRAPKAKAPAAATVRQAETRAADKVHIGAWLHRDFKRGLKIVQAQTDEDVQTILARLLNAEFRARKIPVVEM
jgi:hypothetical protein